MSEIIIKCISFLLSISQIAARIRGQTLHGNLLQRVALCLKVADETAQVECLESKSCQTALFFYICYFI